MNRWTRHSPKAKWSCVCGASWRMFAMSYSEHYDLHHKTR